MIRSPVRRMSKPLAFVIALTVTIILVMCLELFDPLHLSDGRTWPSDPDDSIGSVEP